MAGKRRRSKYDIYADIMEVIVKKGLCSLTRISYGANLPVDRAKKILDFLVSHGFVREAHAGGRIKFRTTKWGLDYLETYKRMQRFFAALKEPVKVKMPEVVLPDRVATGYKDLDRMLFGGIPENYAVILSSPSCDERELLIRKFVETGTEKGQTTFYVTAEAGGMDVLAEKCQSTLYLFVCNPRADIMVKSLPNVFKLKGVDNLTEISIALMSSIRRLDKPTGGPRRACIGIVSDILLQHHAIQTRRWLSALIPDLRANAFTTLAVMNPQMHPSEDVHAILGLFEGEINIYERESERGMERFLKIRKMYNERYIESKLPLRKE